MRRSLLALTTLLLVSSIALPAFASPQPEPVCGACGGSFELAIEREDVDATVVQSTAVVRVHDDGSATWTVRNRLANESIADTLRNRSDALLTATRYANRRSVIEGPFTNTSARVENRTVVLTFEDRYATTEMPGGVHVLDYFHSGGFDSWYVLTANRFTIIGPVGTEVTNDPAGATVSGRNATWHGNASAPLWEAPRVEQDTYVAFAEPDAAATVLTTVAIALGTLPTVVDVLSTFHLPATILFGILLAGVTAISRPLASRFERPQLLAGVIGLAGVVAPLAFFLTGLGRTWMAVGFAAVSFAMGGLTLVRGHRVRPRELVGGGALALAGVALAVSLGASLWQLPESLRSLPLVVAPALGAAVAAGNRRRIALAWALALGAFFVVELVAISPTQRPFGAVVFLLAAYAVAAAALSLPFVLLGAAAENWSVEAEAGPSSDPDGSSSEEQGYGGTD